MTTIPMSLKILLKGQLQFMLKNGLDVIAISSPQKELEEISLIEGVNTFSVEMTRIISPWQDIKSIYFVYKILKKVKPEIIHTHTPKAGIVGMLAAKLTGVPYRLHTVAGLPLLEASGAKRIVLNFVERLTYACATNVYPNSYGLEEIIEREGFCRKEKLKVLANGSSNGIDTTVFDYHFFDIAEKEKLRRDYQIEQDDFVFSFVGRLVKDKGINELVQAFKRIHEQCPKTKLVLVGSFEKELDPLTPETEKEIDSNPAIITTGFQNDVRPYFAISDVFVFPSYREGFPNVVMQAGAMGLPSIVTDINGCNEIIIEGQNGLIIPPKDVQALEQAMLKLLTDAELRTSLAQQARPLIVSRYEQKVVWEALLAEYNRLLNRVV